jgi:malonate transporter
MVGLTMVIIDIMTLGKPSFSAVISRLSKNSTIVALLIGLAFGLLKIELPKGVGVFLSFVSATTAPCALFALGIVLSDSNRSTPIALPMTIIKVIVHPMIAIGTIVLGFQITPEVARPALLVAAGPCGAMAFVMATNYNVRVDAIAKAILFSMVASILSVSLMAAY